MDIIDFITWTCAIALAGALVCLLLYMFMGVVRPSKTTYLERYKECIVYSKSTAEICKEVAREAESDPRRP